MVLKNSKWDRKAKIKHLKKKGDYRDTSADKLEDKSNSLPWDSDDEALLNHFYPSLSSTNVEEKVEIKEQLLKQIEQGLIEPESGDNSIERGSIESESGNNSIPDDSIFLGSNAQRESDLKNINLNENNVNLFSIQDYIDANNRKNRVLLKSDDIDLNDYGLSKLDIKEIEYKTKKNAKPIPFSSLDGYIIGSDNGLDSDSSKIRSLTPSELAENIEKTKLSNESDFINSIKKRYTQPAKKVHTRMANPASFENDEDFLDSLI